MLPVQIAADHRELVSKTMSLTFSCFASFCDCFESVVFCVLLLHNQNPAKYLGDLAKMAVCVFPLLTGWRRVCSSPGRSSLEEGRRGCTRPEFQVPACQPMVSSTICPSQPETGRMAMMIVTEALVSIMIVAIGGI